MKLISKIKINNKMKNKVKISIIGFITIAVALLSESIIAQDTRSSMSYANPLNLNPAIAGANKDFKVLINYRNQWGSLDNGFKTYSVTALYPVFVGKSNSSTILGESGKNGANNVNGKLDFGLNAQKFTAGAFSNLDFALSIGYNIRLTDNNYFSAAILGSYVQKSLDVSKLIFDEQYVLGSYNSSNPNSETVLNDKVTYPSIGFGALWYYNEGESAKLNAFLGAAGYNLNKPNESFTGATGELPRRFTFNGGVKIIGANKIDVTPNVIYLIQGSSQLISAGLYLDYRLNDKSKLVLGSWYKVNDAVTFLIGFDYKLFTIGYGYDVVTSDVARTISGLNTHTISLSFKLDQASKKNLNLNNPFSSF